MQSCCRSLGIAGRTGPLVSFLEHSPTGLDALAADEDHDSVGQYLGESKLERLIARGGMGGSMPEPMSCAAASGGQADEIGAAHVGAAAFGIGRAQVLSGLRHPSICQVMISSGTSRRMCWCWKLIEGRPCARCSAAFIGRSDPGGHADRRRSGGARTRHRPSR